MYKISSGLIVAQYLQVVITTPWVPLIWLQVSEPAVDITNTRAHYEQLRASTNTMEFQGLLHVKTE